MTKERLNQDETLKDICQFSVKQIITLLEIYLNLCDSILVDRAVISNDKIFVCGETSNFSIFFTNCALFWP